MTTLIEDAAEVGYDERALGQGQLELAVLLEPQLGVEDRQPDQAAVSRVKGAVALFRAYRIDRVGGIADVEVENVDIAIVEVVVEDGRCRSSPWERRAWERRDYPSFASFVVYDHLQPRKSVSIFREEPHPTVGPTAHRASRFGDCGHDSAQLRSERRVLASLFRTCP